MWEIKNGILYENDVPKYGIGLSYYASFREDKVPVADEKERIPEMKKDLRRMKECGFNVVRFAARGEIKRMNNQIIADTAFIDALMEEADNVDITTMLRLQGYTMNLSNWDDCYMIDQDGNPIDQDKWWNFVQNCLYHKGIIKDNEEGTEFLARHYAKYKNLVSFQTYNEPHYPAEHLYDYHPETIKAYRKYLVEKGIMEEGEAENYMPPVHKPYNSTECMPWTQWRLFSQKGLSKFLADSAAAAKKADSSIASLTCYTPCPIYDYTSIRGVDFYDTARDMDIVGITHYINTSGSDFFCADLAINFAESAAACYGKHCWIVEYDARTTVTDRKLNEETYMALGAGIKGIMYYQWRGDCPMPTAPEANLCGFLNYDGTEAPNYENGMRMVDFMNRISDKLVQAEKIRSHVGILYSNHAVFMADTATVEGTEKGMSWQQKNSTIQRTRWIYEQLKREGITADVIIPELLAENPLKIQWLLVPAYELLSEEEKSYVNNFKKNGGCVLLQQGMELGFLAIEVENEEDAIPLSAEDAIPLSVQDILDQYGIIPAVKVRGTGFLMTNILEGEDYYLVSLNNIRVKDEPIENAGIQLHFPVSEVYFINPSTWEKLEVRNGTVALPEIRDGGMLYIKK